MAFGVFHHPYFNALRLTFLSFSSKGLVHPFIQTLLFHRHGLGREIPINHFSSYVPVSHLLGLVDEYMTRISFLRLSQSSKTIFLWKLWTLESNWPFSEPLGNQKAGTSPFPGPPRPPPRIVRKYSPFLPKFPSLHPLSSQGGWHQSSRAAPWLTFSRRKLAALLRKVIQNLSAPLLFCWIRCDADLVQWCVYITRHVLGELAEGQGSTSISFRFVKPLADLLCSLYSESWATDDLLNITLLILCWQRFLLPPLISPHFPEINAAVTCYQICI